MVRPASPSSPLRGGPPPAHDALAAGGAASGSGAARRLGESIVSHSLRGRLAALVLSALGLVLAGLPAASAEPGAQPPRPASTRPSDDELRALVRDRARAAAQELRPGGGVAAPAQRRDVGSFTDPESDTVRIETSEDGSSETVTVEPRPEVDLVATGIDLGPTEVSFSATTAGPPPQDDRLGGFVIIDWAVDADADGEPEAIVSSFGGGLDGGAFLFSLDIAEAGSTFGFGGGCSGDSGIDGSTYTAVGFPLGCLGDGVRAASIAVSTFTFDPETNDQFVDSAPDAPPPSMPSGPAVELDGPVAVGERTGPRATARLAGPGRIETAVELSRAAFAVPPDDGVAVAYLSTATDFPDALAAGPLVPPLPQRTFVETENGSFGVVSFGPDDQGPGGPILLVPPCGDLPPVVTGELQRLRPRRVMALGGPAAVCDPILMAAGAAAGGVPIDRLAGATRFQTAVAISEEGFPVDDGGGFGPIGVLGTVLLARADAFPDALSAGSLELGPILLVPSCGEVPPEVLDEVRRLAPSRVLALGGPSAVCDQVRTAVATAAQEAVDQLRFDFESDPEGDGESEPQPVDVTVASSRASGDDRLATSAAIARVGFPFGATDVFLATAGDFPDALAGGALRRGPVLLVPACGPLPDGTTAEIARLNPTRVTALGGPNAICDQVLDDAAR